MVLEMYTSAFPARNSNLNLCSMLLCRRLLTHPGQKGVEF